MPTMRPPEPAILGCWPPPWSSSPPPPVPRRPPPRVPRPPPASPAPPLAAGATDSVQRIHRLLGPSEPLGPVRRHLLRATAAALALTPVLLALTPAVLALALGKLPVT